MATVTTPLGRIEKPARLPEHASVFAANLLYLDLLDRICGALDRAGIPTLCLKGSAFLETLYPDLGERPMCDIDLLCPADRRSDITKIANDLGLRRIPAPKWHRYSYEHHYNWQFLDAENRLLEVHFELCSPGRFSVDYRALRSRSVTYTTTNRIVHTLSPEDSIVYAAIHEAKHGFDVPQKNRDDLARIMDQWSPNWDLVIQIAKDWNAATCTHWVLARIASVPTRVLDDLKPHDLQAWVLRQILERSALPKTSRTAQLTLIAATADDPLVLSAFFAKYLWKRLRDLPRF